MTNGNYLLDQIKLGAYYFPGYHRDPATDRWHGAGWTEWDVLATARPRYTGHNQPKSAAWGRFDESDPVWARRQVDIAAQHGIDFFIYDWYWYENGPFLNGALDRGYLGLEGPLPTKFALMWANHDWLNIHPASTVAPPAVLFQGRVDDYQFDSLTEEVIEKYFLNKNYFHVDGQPYFSIYEMQTFVEGMGGVTRAAGALDRFRSRVQRAGLDDIHLNLVVADRQVLPGERQSDDVAGMIRDLGAASTTSYVWIHHYDPSQYGFPISSYAAAAAANHQLRESLAARQTVPYYPNVTVGWDSSPRSVQSDSYEDRGYPWLAVLEGNTPLAFRKALDDAITFELATDHPTKIVTLNAWNEWTEGSYLLPDTKSGTAYLKACLDAKSSALNMTYKK